MSLTYRAVDWNRQKRIYDATLAGWLLLVLGGFATAYLVENPNVTVETLILRGTALGALALLHVILAIGPLTRLDRRFLPLLYNRRHLGVCLFLLAAVHAGFAVIQYHALGDEHPLISVFTAYRADYLPGPGNAWRFAHVPFEPFGVIALVILFLMAATSHDFWLRQLGPSFWKTLHLGVYLAYGSVLVHVGLGYLQSERDPALVILVTVGFAALSALHLLAAARERRRDRGRAGSPSSTEEFVEACAAADVREGRGTVVLVGGRRLAVWRHQGRLFVTSQVCRHQGGPLGEGRILDGCITCPWHGWNYQPQDGASPPPFHEVVETHACRIVGGRVWIRTEANPLRTHCEGAGDPSEAADGQEQPRRKIGLPTSP